MGIPEGRSGEAEEKEEMLRKGDIVVVPFPFSDLSSVKIRPALVVAILPGRDVILCMITTFPHSEWNTIPIDESDIEVGHFRQQSYIRPARLFTADRIRIIYKIGSFKRELTERATQALVSILTA